MDDKDRRVEPADGAELDEDVEAHLVKESLAAGVAAAGIFVGSAKADPFPPPGPTIDPPAAVTVGSDVASAALQERAAAKVTANKAVTGKKAKKGKKAKAAKKQQQQPVVTSKHTEE